MDSRLSVRSVMRVSQRLAIKADGFVFDRFGKILDPLLKEVLKAFGIEHGEHTTEGVV